jgi:cytochrome c peroxidase
MRKLAAAIVIGAHACALVACSASSGPGAAPTPGLDAGGDAGGADASGAGRYCDGGTPTTAYPTATSGFDVRATLPDLSFDAIDEGGPRKVALHDLFEPCAARSRLLVVRVSAAWCGTCRWHAGHTAELRALDVGPRLEVLDLLVSDEDNVPVSTSTAPRALAAWRARIDAPGIVGADPSFAFAPALGGVAAPLPLIVLVDTRTMVVRSVLHDPDPDLLAQRLHEDLAALDGALAPELVPPQRFDARFTREQRDMIAAIAPPGAPPPDPTNQKADDPAASALGKALFSDGALGGTGVSCATCHRPEQHFMDGAPQSHDGRALVDRNSPSVLLASQSRWQFWDGRADTLWMQALGPPENAKEMGSTRLAIAHQIFTRYRAAYEALFGAMPPLDDAARFPASGKPGDAAWQAMAAADQEATTRVYVGYGKAVAAFERSLRVLPNRLDAYAAGDAGALSAAEKDGLRAFFAAGCAQCHYGPRLTDDAFHAVRFPTGRQDGAPDTGRVDGVPQLLAGEFLSTGPYSDLRDDARALGSLAPVPSMLGAFKTPALRGVADTAPYGHGGTLATLEDVAHNYAEAGLATTNPAAVGVSEPWMPRFDPPTANAIPAFLRVLTADPAP